MGDIAGVREAATLAIFVASLMILLFPLRRLWPSPRIPARGPSVAVTRGGCAMRPRSMTRLLLQVASVLVATGLVALFTFSDLGGRERRAEAVDHDTGASQGTASWNGPPLGCRAGGHTGQVDAGDAAVPVVDATWELPDMQSKVTGVQYWVGSGPMDLNNNGIPDADDDPLTPGMQTYPNLCDEPEPRDIEYWVVAEDPNGVDDISAAASGVWHPDGSFNYQVDLTPVDCSAIGLWDGGDGTSVVEIHAPLNAAIDTDQISQAAAAALVERCYKHEVVVYKGTKKIEHQQMAGAYTVIGYAADRQANVGTLTNHFMDMPVIGLSVDRGAVDWGAILPRLTGQVSDEALTSPDKPTVTSCGNADMRVGLEFSEMVSTGGPVKAISSFGATWMGQSFDFVPDVVQWFGTCLNPSSPKQLGLSIHTPVSLPPGAYRGTLGVYGEMCPGWGLPAIGSPLAYWRWDVLSAPAETVGGDAPTITPPPTDASDPTAIAAPTAAPVPTWTTAPTDEPTQTNSPVPTDTPPSTSTPVPTHDLAVRDLTFTEHSTRAPGEIDIDTVSVVIREVGDAIDDVHVSYVAELPDACSGRWTTRSLTDPRIVRSSIALSGPMPLDGGLVQIGLDFDALDVAPVAQLRAAPGLEITCSSYGTYLVSLSVFAQPNGHTDQDLSNNTSSGTKTID